MLCDFDGDKPSIHVTSFVSVSVRARNTSEYFLNLITQTFSHDCSVFASLSKELEELESALNGICFSVVVSATPGYKQPLR